MAGAEALLEQHQEHKGEIEARADSFAQTAETGQRLLDEDIDNADEIRQCLQVKKSQFSENNEHFFVKLECIYMLNKFVVLFFRIWPPSRRI